MNKIASCAGDDDGSGSGSESERRQTKLSISKVSGDSSGRSRDNLEIFAKLLLLAFVATLTQSSVIARATRPMKNAHLSNDDLIEGRLDTSQACGLRHESNQPENLYYIVGGDEVEDDQFWPWSIAIYELDPLNGNREFICSGSLISEHFVLTAAHCIHQSRFDILEANEVFLKIASIRLDDDQAQFYRVDKIFLHPNYTVGRKANDIALLRLPKAQKLPRRARPICLPSQVANRVDFTDQQVTIIGWGQTSAQSGDEPTRLIDIDDDNTNDITSDFAIRRSKVNETLLQAEVRVTSTDQCNKNYSKLEISWLNIDDHFICASDPDGKRDACQGDSGGPLMWSRQQQRKTFHNPKPSTNTYSNSNSNNNNFGYQTLSLSQPSLYRGAEKWYQLGLVSFGHGCANSQFPGVYTRISYYMPWILKTAQMEGGSN